jgi:hypothetical protein
MKTSGDRDGKRMHVGKITFHLVALGRSRQDVVSEMLLPKKFSYIVMLSQIGSKTSLAL